MNFRDSDRLEILNTMKDDVALLETFNLMDYSLLLCVTVNPNWVKNMTEAQRLKVERKFTKH